MMRIAPLLRASEVRALRGQIRACSGSSFRRGPSAAETLDWSLSRPAAPEGADRTNAGCAVMPPVLEQAAWPDAPLPEELAEEFECPTEDCKTADTGGGCEGSAPEGTSGASDGASEQSPANADQRHASEGRLEPSGRVETGACAKRAPVSSRQDVEPRPVAARLDLGGIRSEMDRRAEATAAKHTASVEATIAAKACGEQALCRCGATRSGAIAGPVPAWFGADCIEAGCPLKGATNGD